MKPQQTSAMPALPSAPMDAQAIQALFADTNYRLRESRKAILRRYAVHSEAELLLQVKQARVAEHPAYELYLSALILEQSRLQIRAEMVQHLDSADQDDLPSISLHLALREQLQARYAARLARPVAMAQDALQLAFDTGLSVEVRYFSTQEYSIAWKPGQSGDAELRIDTAPLHPGCATFPNHLHRQDGTLAPDVLTVPGADSWANLSRLLDRLLVDPLCMAIQP